MRNIHLSKSAALLAVLLAGGCATTKPIPMGNDTYLLSQTSAGGVFRSMSSLKADVITRANAFGASQGKVAVPIASRESPAYPGHMPNFEYQFRLVDKSDPRASGGALLPRADVVIEQHADSTPDRNVQGRAAAAPDVYAQLIKLDDLHKRGILTDGEFEAQKKKLLLDAN